MCGICGIADPKGVDAAILCAMRDVMTHRGPDDAGIYINPDHTIGLGHRRLSIIDVSPKGRNPLSNEDGSLQIVFNGEFYNYQEYVGPLKEAGHVFRSDTDTEVFLHLYEEYGIEVLHKMRGMFALAIWDAKKQSLILARDRVGIKPLYYSVSGDGLVFASELKGLMQYPGIGHSLDTQALNFYFALGYIPNPLSIYKAVRKLKPGHILTWHAGQITEEQYWTLPASSTTLDLPENEALDQLQALVEDSVKLRLISDVPLGVFLSGGVDSSIVACVMSQFSSHPVKTFSIGFEEEGFNELPYARQVAAHIGADHHELIVKPDAVSVIQTLVRQFDEPFADSSAIPQFYVSQMARQSVTVALGGDGGDELFGGYNWYKWVIQGVGISRALGPTSKIAPAINRRWPYQLPGRNYLGRLGYSPFEQFNQRINIFDTQSRAHLFNPDLLKSLDMISLGGNFAYQFDHGKDLLDSMQRTDFHYYLPEDILTKVDRTSMLVALEARVPLLDHRLVEFAFGLPPKYKINRGIKKYLLKRLARRLLPPSYPLERKKGFSIPVSRWLKYELNPLFDQVLNSGQLWDYLERDYVGRLYQEHKLGVQDHGVRLWAILCFSLWAEQVRVE